MKYKDIIEAEGKKSNEISDIEKNWFNHNAKRYFIPNSFDFKLESIGIYRNEELIKMACNILINRMEELKTQFQNNIEIQKIQ